MKKPFFSILVICLLITAYDKNNDESRSLACVKDKTYEFDNESICNDGVRVEEYIFQSKTVFVFDQGTCGVDMASLVIDSDCNELGYLGGYAGNIVINGENFDHAIFVKTIWEK